MPQNTCVTIVWRVTSFTMRNTITEDKLTNTLASETHQPHAQGWRSSKESPWTLWHTGGSLQGHPRYTSASTEGGPRHAPRDTTTATRPRLSGVASLSTLRLLLFFARLPSFADDVEKGAWRQFMSVSRRLYRSPRGSNADVSCFLLWICVAFLTSHCDTRCAPSSWYLEIVLQTKPNVQSNVLVLSWWSFAKNKLVSLCVAGEKVPTQIMPPLLGAFHWIILIIVDFSCALEDSRPLENPSSVLFFHIGDSIASAMAHDAPHLIEHVGETVPPATAA